MQQNGTTFSGVVSLGKANINAPRSESEIRRNMEILNKAQGNEVIKISLSVPSSSDGFVQYVLGECKCCSVECFYLSVMLIFLF